MNANNSEGYVFDQTIITFDLLVRMFIRVIADAGFNHVAAPGGLNSGCRYTNFENGRLVSVCIVGRVFDYLGILRATIRDHNDLFNTNAEGSQYGACEMSEPLWVRAEAMGVTFTPEAQAFARKVQEQQDNGKSWGNALRDAMESHMNVAVAEAEYAVEQANLAKSVALRGLPTEPVEQFWDEDELRESPFAQ